MQRISKDQYLQALGLFTLGVQYAREAETARKGLVRLLGRDGAIGQIDDVMFDERYQKPRDLDAALAEAGFAVADE